MSVFFFFFYSDHAPNSTACIWGYRKCIHFRYIESTLSLWSGCNKAEKANYYFIVKSIFIKCLIVVSLCSTKKSVRDYLDDQIYIILVIIVRERNLFYFASIVLKKGFDFALGMGSPRGVVVYV